MSSNHNSILLSVCLMEQGGKDQTFSTVSRIRSIPLHSTVTRTNPLPSLLVFFLCVAGKGVMPLWAIRECVRAKSKDRQKAWFLYFDLFHDALFIYLLPPSQCPTVLNAVSGNPKASIWPPPSQCTAVPKPVSNRP